jgi:threonine dehydrogenase-like Zn-dependent dehydrogenase
MRAVVMRHGTLVVDDVPDPTPGAGEVLVKTLACGICGSDLHALKNADRMVEASRRTGSPFVLDVSRDIVMGHEFSAEIVDYGPDTARGLRPGTRVCSLPLLLRGSAS